jgi:DNA-3-methyladenine glycosylase I
MKTHIRCPWANPQNPLYLAYHDTEWGVPVHDDRTHFEFLILEGAQAGLSWETVLNKRAPYKTIFHNFDAGRVATMTDDELAAALQNPGIIRNKLKVFAARKNAQVFLNIQKEFGSFDAYVWRFIGSSPRFNSWSSLPEIPTSTPESDALAKDLKKRGMTFVGSTIMYAYMQAVGLVNDHLMSCWKYTKSPLAV